MENKTQPIGFTLKKITTEQFAIVEEFFIDGEKVGLSTELQFGVDKTKRIVGALTTFKFKCKEIPFLIIGVGCHFEINETSWNALINVETGKTTIPKGFLSHLAMLTVGTTRGILHNKTEGTPFNRFILPTINVAELVTEDISV